MSVYCVECFQVTIPERTYYTYEGHAICETCKVESLRITYDEDAIPGEDVPFDQRVRPAPPEGPNSQRIRDAVKKLFEGRHVGENDCKN